ncbi:hypothetical protein [Rugosimonospora africana]|uniref:HicB family protein n=1 Tax=Rugosimonospora africana TaxID=556532 RepID=A0A8J3VU08_9ACTN|nr:hypothetical protein [Rugosimonospora africana]GIH18564.1 hypothetical protein Raf01_67360 [Rugosimonospora africana]
MDLEPYVDSLSRALAAAGTAGGEDAQAFLDRFVGPLESAIRLNMLNALSAAADEISTGLAAGSVYVRLREGNPEFVVDSPASGGMPEDVADDMSPAAPAAPLADDGATSRISLRLPERLKSRVDEAAGREGLSVNTWLVRVVAATIEAEDRRGSSGRRGLQIGQSYRGWTR